MLAISGLTSDEPRVRHRWKLVAAVVISVLAAAFAATAPHPWIGGGTGARSEAASGPAFTTPDPTRSSPADTSVSALDEKRARRTCFHWTEVSWGKRKCTAEPCSRQAGLPVQRCNRSLGRLRVGNKTLRRSFFAFYEGSPTPSRRGPRGCPTAVLKRPGAAGTSRGEA